MRTGLRVGLGVAAAGLVSALSVLPGLDGAGPSGAAPGHSVDAPNWTSTNWAGYAVDTTTYTSVTGTWKVPSVTSTKPSAYSQAFVGIDGYSNSFGIEVGTSMSWTGGAAHYGAWWRILPAAPNILNLTIAPGNTVTASIARSAAGHWVVSLTDGTQVFTKATNYSGLDSSAEWIIGPPIVNGVVAPLAHFTRTYFTKLLANGSNPKLVSTEGGGILSGSTVLAVPSMPSSAGNAFDVQYGDTVPPAP